MRTPRRFVVCHLLVALLVGGTALDAHDFWLAATPSSETAARVYVVAGHVGEHFPVPNSPTTPDRVDVWRVLGVNGEHAVPRDFYLEGQSLATKVRLPLTGVFLGVMTIRAREIDMTGQEFTDYLREEGLDRVIAERARLGQSGAPARERFARYAKVVIGHGAPAPHLTRPVGGKAELVPLRDTGSVRPGDTLDVRLLVDGRPVAGAMISALDGQGRVDARTNAGGVATLRLARAGAWLVKTVHMTKPVDAGTPPADWESFWVTLTFTVAAPS